MAHEQRRGQEVVVVDMCYTNYNMLILDNITITCGEDLDFEDNLLAGTLS